MGDDFSSTQYSTYHVKIPHDRIGVVIGPDGRTKKVIEKRSSTSINIDSESGSVEVVSSQDPLGALRACDVVKAIGRGFSPEKVFRLFDDDLLMLDIIDLSEDASTPKELKRIKGRIIGRDGKTRNVIETLTDSKVSIYGKTVSILGRPEQIEIVRSAIAMLIEGAPHSHVYAFLEKKRKRLKELG
ncbi:MAG: KH domain-containing protein [Halobacteriota archaeon]|nr:KH domain-containing protein [Halobacteriota archaeon]